MIEYERGGGHSLPPSKQPLVQNNLEMYRNLKGTVYTSPVQKKDRATTLVQQKLRMLQYGFTHKGNHSSFLLQYT